MLKVIFTSAIVFGIGLHDFAMAQESVDSLREFAPQVAPRNFEISIKAESLQYPTEVSADPRLSQNNMLEVNFRGAWETNLLRSGLDISAGKSTNLNYDYIAVQEIYGQIKSSSSVYKLSAGRKFEYWNQADRDWNLGLWEPLFQHDGLRLKGQGLTGLFLNIETSNLQFLGFVSPIFVPTMTPEISESQGAIVSESRWFRSLPNSQSIVGKDTRLVYDLQIPPASEIINNPSYGVRLRVGEVDAGPWASISYGRKAVNALSFRYDASILTQTNLIVAESDAKAEIELNPVTHRHEIMAADIGFRRGSTVAGLSVIQDRPEIKKVENRVNNKGFQTDFIQQQIQPATILTSSFSSVVPAGWLNRKIEWRLDGLKALSKNSTDYDTRGIEQSQLIPDRLQYTNAASVSLNVPVTNKLKSTFRYLREFDQLGTLVSLNLEYAVARAWLLSFGVDSLGVDDPEAQQNDTRFLNRYRQNDRVFGGLSYVY